MNQSGLTEDAQNMLERMTSNRSVFESEAKVLCKRLLLLQEAVRATKENPEFWCRKCNWTGNGDDCEWTDGTPEYPHDQDPFCPQCGRTDEGFPVAYLDEFVPHEYAAEFYALAEKI